MIRPQTFIKDPDSQLDYDVDFTAWLAPIVDTITSVAWIVPAGLTNVAVSNTTLVAKIYLGGGTLGQTYKVTCRITTAAAQPRIKDKSFYIRIKER